MKKLTLLGFMCLALILAALPFAACAEEAPAPAAPAVAPAAPAETVYSVLDPRGIEPEIEFQGISPRLDTLVGKTVGVVSFGRGNADLVMPTIGPSVTALVPECNTVYYYAQGSRSRLDPADWEFIESCDAVILGHDY